MQGKVIKLGEDIPGAVSRIPSIIISPQLGPEAGNRGEEIRAEGLLGELFLTQMTPDLTVGIVIQKLVPLFTDEKTVAERFDIQVGEYHLQDVVGKAVYTAVHDAGAQQLSPCKHSPMVVEPSVVRDDTLADCGNVAAGG